MRLFAAIDLSPGTQDAMAAEQKRIAASLGSTVAPLKWVRPDHAHLTLVFLGDVDAMTVPSLVDTVGMDVEMPPFDIVVSGIGVSPRHGAPRVLGHRALALGRSGAIARQGVEWATLYESRLSPAGATYVPLTRASLTRT